MSRVPTSIVLALLVLLTASLLPPAPAAASETDGQATSLFVNLTSDELNRAAMAIFLATHVRTEREIPVTVFLNVEGARLAGRELPQNTYVDGETLAEKLQAFLSAGGRVIVCPMCMRNVAGLEPADLHPGIEVGESHVTLPAMLEPGVKILSY
jgi:predicted peroxiredoxin